MRARRGPLPRWRWRPRREQHEGHAFVASCSACSWTVTRETQAELQSAADAHALTHKPAPNKAEEPTS